MGREVFIGDSNQLRGEVLGADGRYCDIRLKSGSVLRGTNAGIPKIGAAVTAVVRPRTADPGGRGLGRCPRGKASAAGLRLRPHSRLPLTRFERGTDMALLLRCLRDVRTLSGDLDLLPQPEGGDALGRDPAPTNSTPFMPTNEGTPT